MRQVGVRAQELPTDVREVWYDSLYVHERARVCACVFGLLGWCLFHADPQAIHQTVF